MFPQFPGAPPVANHGAGTKTRGAPPEPDNLEFIFPRRARGGDAAPSAPAVDTIAPLRDIVHDPPRTAPSARSRPVDTAPVPPIVTATRVDIAASPVDDVTLADDPVLGDEPDVDDDALLAARPTFEDDTADDDPLADDDLTAARGPRHDAAPASHAAASPSAPRVLDMEAMMSASARIRAFRPATRFLVTLVAAFTLLALFVRANPERTEAWLARVPLIGSALTARPALGARITLSAVDGGYQRLRTGRRIFVISGKATNNSLVAVERIEVEGELYAASGSVARKVISTGNRTTLKLRDLSESEIALLQNLDTRQTVAPGGSVDFAIVFLEPPRDLREFSYRVLTARATGRAPDPSPKSQSPPSVG